NGRVCFRRFVGAVGNVRGADFCHARLRTLGLGVITFPAVALAGLIGPLWADDAATRSAPSVLPFLGAVIWTPAFLWADGRGRSPDAAASPSRREPRVRRVLLAMLMSVVTILA